MAAFIMSENSSVDNNKLFKSGINISANDNDTIDDSTLNVETESFLVVRIIEVSCLALIALIGCPGNALIVFVQLKNKAKSSTDYFVMTMAVFEFICSSGDVGSHLVRILFNPQVKFGLCKLSAQIGYMTSASSAFLLAAIAIDRYLKTCRALAQTGSVQIAKRLCVVFSIASFLFGTPGLITMDRNLDINQCFVNDKYAQEGGIWNAMLTILVIIVFVIMLFCYIRISIFLRLRYKKKSSTDETLKQRSQPTNSFKGDSQQTGIGSNFTPIVSNDSNNGLSNEKQSVTTSDMAVGVFEESERFSNSTNGDKGSSEHNMKYSAREVGHKTKGKSARSQKKKEVANKTTRITFLISVIYIITWSTACAVLLTNYSTDMAVISIGYLLAMFNCITNPLLFMSMSSRFRESAMYIVCRRK